MGDSENTQLRVRIHGKVQGVWFRAWSEQTAREIGLRGWVRNRHDGTVEAVLSGEAALVDRMLEKFKDGPPLARVDRIEREADTSTCPFEFEVRPDA